MLLFFLTALFLFRKKIKKSMKTQEHNSNNADLTQVQNLRSLRISFNNKTRSRTTILQLYPEFHQDYNFTKDEKHTERPATSVNVGTMTVVH